MPAFSADGPDTAAAPAPWLPPADANGRSMPAAANGGGSPVLGAPAAALTTSVSAEKGGAMGGGHEKGGLPGGGCESTLNLEPLRGLDICFHNLRYKVNSRKGATTILKNVSGYALASRVTALLGPSGAGKSTLLKTLACSVSGGEVHGSIYVNGAPMIAKEFRTQSAVVWQRDILLQTATVREAIMTSALLKLPQAMPLAEKRRRVDEIVSELSLRHRASMMIGEDIDGTVSSISGGERRRVSIGIALVTDPRAVFLDEPTTGLDSDSALSIVCLLKRLASRGRTVLCTIHQPSADICERFDDFMLLSGGCMVYCGAWRAAEAWFDGLGHPRPSHRNLAEHFMVLCKDAEVVAASSAAHRDTFSLDAALGDAEAGGPGYERTLSRWSLRHTVTAQALGSSAAPDAEHAAAATSSWYQIRCLSVRFARHMWRAPLNVIIQLVQYLFFGTLVGLTYWKVPDDMNGGTFDRIASLWFICACLVLQPAQNAVAVFSRERALLRREFGNRLYNYFAFFTAKSLTQLPLQLTFVMAFSLLVYFMIGFQAVASKFFVFYACLVLVALTADTVGQLCAAVHREVVVGQIINGMLCLLLLMFTGFIQTETPIYFIWLKKASFVAFAYSAVVRNEFTGLKLQGPLLPVDGMDAVPANVNNGLKLPIDFAWLIGIMLAIRVATYGWIALSLRKHWF